MKSLHLTKQTVLSCICLFSLFAVIWWMCANVIWLGDDLDYKYMMKGEIWQSWGKIKTTKDFFESQLIHYQHINGRIVAHTLVQLFNARLGQQAFAVCNGFVYILFALLIGKAGGVRIKDNPDGTLSAIILSILCFITKMMPTCQIGYIWGMTANLGWLMLFFHKGRPTWWATIGIMLAGIIVGNWQESVSIGVCGGLGIWWIIQLIDSVTHHQSKFDCKRSWMLLGYVAGTATNCLAPSTMGRVSDISMSLTDQLLIASYSFPAIVLLIITILFMAFRHGSLIKFSFKNSDGCIPDGVLLAGILLLIIFNIVIGIYSNRQLFGANLLASVLTLRLLPHHRFGILINTIAAVAIVIFWALMLQGIAEVRHQYNEIASLHSESEDGKVYFDRHRVMTLGFPLRSKYYEDILGQFDNDLHHSLMKDFKHIRKGRTLKLIPITKPIANLSDAEEVEQYAPGHFNVTLKEPLKGETPRKILVFGHYPFGIKSGPKLMEITKYSLSRPPYATSVIIPEYPFFTADSLVIVPQ